MRQRVDTGPQIGGPLDLRRPILVPQDTLGRDLRELVQLQNDALRRVFDSTVENFPAPSAQIPRLVATVRWSILHHTREECQQHAQFGGSTVAKLERERGKYHEETTNKGMQQRLVEKLFRYWDDHNVPRVVREQILDLLQQQHGGISGFYRRLRYEFPDFEQRAGISHELLMHREQANVVPNYHEVASVVRKLFPGRGQAGRALRERRQSQARIAWMDSKAEHLTEQRDLEPPLASFLIALEVHLAERMRCPCSGVTFQEHFGGATPFGVSQLNTNRLVTGRLVEWGAIAAVAEQVLAPDQYEGVRQGWEEAMTAEAARPSFAMTFFRCKNERGIAMRDLADALGIRAPEERGRGCKPNRVQHYRRSSGIRHAVVEGNGFFDQVSIRALIALVAEDDEERKYLEEVFRSERRRFYRRSGSTLTGDRLTLTIERELNSARPEYISAYLLQGKRRTSAAIQSLAQRIRKFEWSTRGCPPLNTEELDAVLSALDDIGKRQAADALARRPLRGEKLLARAEFTAIPTGVQTLIEAAGSLSALNKRLQRSVGDPRFLIGTGRLAAMRHGEYCPPLPVLEHLLRTMGIELNDAVRRDWYRQFPISLQRRKQSPLTKPLPRLLSTLIHSCEVDVPQFCEERLPGVEEATVRRAINLPERGEDPDWRYVSQILTAAEVGEGTIPWELAELLTQGKKTPAVIRRLRPRLRREGLDLHPANLPGLTFEEIGVKPPPTPPPRA